MRTTESRVARCRRSRRALGVSRATLYAYVSRGRIRSEAAPGGERRRRYSRDDIERLVARSRERRNPEKAAEQALHWGLPILESAITLIADERIYYRGHDARALARERSVADVAALIWTGTADGAHSARRRARLRRRAHATARRSSPRRSRRSHSPLPTIRSRTICGRAR